MKRFFTVGAIALVMFTGVGLAYGEQVANAPKANETVYTWNRTGGDPLPEETNPFVGTKTAAQNYYGCSGTVDECAIGTPTSIGLPQEVIYQH